MDSSALGPSHFCASQFARPRAKSIAFASQRNAFVFAVDLPDRLRRDTGEIDPDSVVADFTVAIGFAKHGLLADAAIDFVGRIVVLPLPDLEAGGARNEIMATPQALRGLDPATEIWRATRTSLDASAWWRVRKGFVGAALMTAAGALRAGAGLVELFVPEDIYEIVATAAPPEVMVKTTRAYRDLPDERIDVWAIGPGLGTAHGARSARSHRAGRKPMVVDADGFNSLAEEIEVLKRCRGPRLLTPHPGEMERLLAAGKMTRAGDCEKFLRGLSRHALA